MTKKTLLQGLAEHHILNPQDIWKQDIDLQMNQNVSLDHIQTLDQLREHLQNIPHPFKQFSKNLVFGDGNDKSKIMVIGEAPGAEEDMQRKPFVGQSGMLLSEILLSIGLIREQNFYITNIIPWRPAMNQTPSLDEIKFFLPYVVKHIELISPKVLILVGSTAYKALSIVSNLDSRQTITKIRGKMQKIHINGNDLHAVAIFHPSYLLRAPAQKKVMWQDMLVLEQELKNMQIL